MESIIKGLVGDFPLLQVCATLILILGAYWMTIMGKKSGEKEANKTFSEADALRMRSEITDEQSDSRKKIYDSISNIHNRMEVAKDFRDRQHEVLSDRIHDLATRLTAVETENRLRGSRR